MNAGSVLLLSCHTPPFGVSMTESDRKVLGFRATSTERRTIDLAAVHLGKRRDAFLRDAALAEAQRILADLPEAA